MSPARPPPADALDPGATLDFEIVIEEEPAFRSLARADSVSFSRANTVRIRVPAGRLGHYDLVRKIGEGGMGRVFEVRDVRNGERAALKMLFDVDPASVYRLKREFRRMLGIAHHNLVTLHELVVDEHACFFTMEYVSGLNFREALVRNLGEDLQRLREALRQLTYGVDALHSAGRVHRDLKPHNVLITDEPRVVVLDFGLAREVEHQTIFTTSSGLVQGTPAYMAPEQVVGQLATPASDWYAVGGMLYEVLSGRVPYVGGVMEILLNKQYDDPVPLAQHCPELDPELEALVMALLHREPEQRPGPVELLAWCAGASPRRVSSRMVSQRRDQAALMGREGHLATLGAAFDELASGFPACVDVRGASGTGKTALVEAFLKPLRGADSVVILESRCSERELVPYRALDSIVDELAAFLRKLSSRARRQLLDGIQEQFAALCQIFPVLYRADPTADGLVPRAPHVDAASRRRAFAGFKHLVYRLAQQRALILVIDDLHRGDDDSAWLLLDLLSPPSVPPLLLICTYDSDAEGYARVLVELQHLRTVQSLPYTVRTITTELLAETEAIELALQLMDGPRSPFSEFRARAIALESGGNPMLVEALARVDSSVLADDERAQRTTSVGRGGLLRKLIRARLRELHPAARELLALFAASRGPLDLEIIRHAARSRADPRTVLAQLRGSRLVRVSERAGALAVTLYHDQLRAAFEALVGAESMADCHRRLAEAMESLGHDEPELLAYHYSQGGRPDEAAEYASQAAYAAAKSLAFDRAAELYTLAVECKPDAWILRRRCADMLVKAGHGTEAAEYYLSAAELAPPRSTGALRRAAAEQFLLNGHLETGLEVVEPLLREHGVELPAGARQSNSLFAKYADRLTRRGPRYTERSEVEIHRGELELLDLLWIVARGLLLNDPIRGGYFLMRNACHALDVGEPHRIARALALVGVFSTTRQHGERADFISTAESIARSLRDEYTAGLTSIVRGIKSRNAGEWHAAIVDLEFGIDHLREHFSSVGWECSLAMRSLLAALEAIGELRSLAHRVQQFQQQAQTTGGMLMGLLAATSSALTLVAADNPGEARRRVRSALAFWPRTGFHVQHLQALKVEVLCDLYEGAHEDAWARVVEAWSAIEDSNFMRLPSRRVEVLLLRARSALALVADDPARHRRLLTVVEQDLAQLERESYGYVDGHARLLHAGVRNLYGESDAVREHLEAAVAGYDAAGMLLMAACARWSLGLWRGGDVGDAEVRKSEAFMTMQTVSSPLRWVRAHAPGLVTSA
ncbi:MAG: protein kinase [Myxococcales bacterium]|nr:protein kinase [Myxococcales bacterium]